MQHEGRWLVPYLSDRPFLEHPPLAYALIGASLSAFGASETAARLPGAVASLGTSWLVFALARRLCGPRAGLAALLALVGMAGFFRYSHRALVDPVLTVFLALGCFAYVRAAWPDESAGAHERVPWRPLLGLYAAAALAFLVKGPVGPALLAAPIAFDVLLFRGLGFARSWAHAAGAALFVSLCGGWLAWLRHAEGTAALQTFWLQNGVLRILPSAGLGPYAGGHVRELWYYLPRIPQMLGWTIGLLPALVAWFRRGGPPHDARGAALRFLALVFPIGVVLLSLAGTKRGLYLLPVTVPLAVPVGAWIDALTRPDPRRSRIELATARICAAAVCSRRELRADGTGPFRAPRRVAALVYAGCIAWNLVVAPRMGLGRDLGPLSRAAVATWGPGPVVGYRLGEDVRGAIPFYTGRIVQMLDGEEAVARYTAAHPDGLLLVGGKEPVHAGGRRARPVWSARAPEGFYVLVRAGDL
ncbi:MAG TPA: glycosyltransferase family 39 protein [Myxococcota bacterium]|nr:glycosyltransferase family 39 protein [Myxococcota bacterium]